MKEAHSVMVKASWKERLILVSSAVSMLAVFTAFLFLLGKFLAGIAPFLLIMGLFFGDYMGSYIIELRAEKERNRIQKENQESSIPFVFREALFCFLTGNMAQVLGFQRPETVEDITPTAYYVKQCSANRTYYRFIAYKAEDSQNMSFSKIRRHMNQYFAQQLQSGYFYIEPLFYKNFPAIYVTRIAPDTSSPGYLAIDMMFIRDEFSYNYAQNIEYHDKLESRKKPPHTPFDKEF